MSQALRCGHLAISKSLPIGFEKGSASLPLVHRGNFTARTIRRQGSQGFGCRLSARAAAGDNKGDIKETSPSFRSADKQDAFKTSEKVFVSLSDEDDDEEEEVTWLEEKFDSLVATTESVFERIPGPRVGESNTPWLVALPVTYLGVTLIIALIRTWRKLNTPKERRKRQVNKNAFLVEALGEYFPAQRESLTPTEVTKLEVKLGFSKAEICRKYIRYALNERPFTPALVADLLHLHTAAALSHEDTADILNDVGKRIVKAKGPIVMNTAGMTEKGVKRKAAVQALFAKLLYLSELEDFVPASVRSKVELKQIFGVTDADADSIRIETLTEVSDMDTLETLAKSESFGEADSDAEDDSVSSEEPSKEDRTRH